MGRSCTDGELLAAVDAYREHGNQYRAAEALGINQSSFNNRLKRAAERGFFIQDEPAMPGFRISQTSETQDKDGQVVRLSLIHI